MKKEKRLELNRRCTNVLIVLAILVILVPLDYKEDFQIWEKVIAGVYIVMVTSARFIEKKELKIIMKRYGHLGKDRFLSNEYKSVHTNEVNTLERFFYPPLIHISKVNVEIFEEALEKYKYSQWRTVRFTKKAQKALDNIIQQFDKQ